MFIVWGKKLVHRKLGHVADFCPICRGPRAFTLTRVGSAGHVYYVTVGQGELVGHERTCLDCGTSLPADPTAYASVSRKLVKLSDLARQTYPNFKQALAARLALEEKVQRTPLLLTPEERRALIRNPFLLLSPKVEKRFASTHIDREIAMSIGGAVVAMVAVPAVARTLAPDAAELALLVCMVLGLLLVAWQFATSGRRFMQRKVAPLLARALFPLNPSASELNSVLAELKQLGHRIGTKLKLADLQPHLRSGAAG